MFIDFSFLGQSSIQNYFIGFPFSSKYSILPDLKFRIEPLNKPHPPNSIDHFTILG